VWRTTKDVKAALACLSVANPRFDIGVAAAMVWASGSQQATAAAGGGIGLFPAGTGNVVGMESRAEPLVRASTALRMAWGIFGQTVSTVSRRPMRFKIRKKCLRTGAVWQAHETRATVASVQAA
jgi:hypothetical protein